MSFTDLTSHDERSLLKLKASENMALMSVTCETSHNERSPLNRVAPTNMYLMLVTCETSHNEMSPLNRLAPSNMPQMLVTCETHQPLIGHPYVSATSVPLPSSWRYYHTASRSSTREAKHFRAALATGHEANKFERRNLREEKDRCSCGCGYENRKSSMSKIGLNHRCRRRLPVGGDSGKFGWRSEDEEGGEGGEGNSKEGDEGENRDHR